MDNIFFDETGDQTTFVMANSVRQNINVITISNNHPLIKLALDGIDSVDLARSKTTELFIKS